MEFLKQITQQQLQSFKNLSQNDFSQEQFVSIMLSTDLYFEFEDSNLIDIFNVIIRSKNQNDKKLPKNEFIELVQKINSQMVLTNIQLSQISEENLINIIENFKIVFKEFSLKNSSKEYKKQELIDYLFKNNFSQKILTIKLTDNFKKNKFALYELKKFYEDLEKEIIYQSQQINTDSLNPSTLLNDDTEFFTEESQIIDDMDHQKMPIEFIDQIQYYLTQIRKVGKFQGQSEAQFFNYRDNIIDKCQDKTSVLKKMNEKLRDKVNDFQKSKNFLENKVKTLCTQFDNREAQITELEQIIQDQKENIQDEQFERQKLEKKILEQEKQYTKEIEQLIEENKLLKEKNKDLNSQVVQLQSLQDDSKQLRDRFQSELNKEKKKSIQYENESLELFTLKNQNAVYLKKLEELQQNLDQNDQTSKQRIKELTEQNNNYIDVCAELRLRIRSLEDEKNEIEKQYNDNIRDSFFQKDSFLRENRLDDESMIRNDPEGSIVQVQQNLGIRKNSFDEDMDDMNMTDNLGGNFETLNEEQRKKVDESLSMTLLSGLNQNRKGKIDNEIKQKSEQIQSLKIENYELKENIDLLKKEHNQILQDQQQQKLEIQNAQSQVVEFKTENENLNKKILNQNEVLLSLETQIEELNLKIQNSNIPEDQNQKQSEETIKKIQQEKKDLVLQLKQQNTQFVSLQGEMEVLQKQKNNLEQTQIEFQEIKENLQLKEHKIQQLQNENQNQIMKFEKLQTKNQQLQEECNELRNISLNFSKDDSMLKESILANDPKLKSLENIFGEDDEEKTKIKTNIQDQKNIFTKKSEENNNFESGKKSQMINNILQQQNTQKQKKQVKTYSYDHLEVWRELNILKVISKYQIVQGSVNWYSDEVCRVNSRNQVKKKFIVITQENLYLFNSKEHFKKSIQILDIIKIIHNKNHNYLVICRANARELLEVYRKEEMLVFLKQQMKKQGMKFHLIERTKFVKFDSFNNLVNFDPSKKEFGRHFNKTISLGSKLELVGLMKIDKDNFFFDSKKEILALLTNFGLICFKKGSKEILDFIPLADAEIIKGPKTIQIEVKILKDKKRQLIFVSKAERDLWFEKLQRTSKELSEKLTLLSQQIIDKIQNFKKYNGL